MVVVAQVVAAELVAKLMNQKTVHFLGRAALEPSVAETEQVEVQPASPVTRQKVIRGMDDADGECHSHQFPRQEDRIKGDVADRVGPLVWLD